MSLGGIGFGEETYHMESLEAAKCSGPKALADCGLSDLGYAGCRFTWSNNRVAPSTVRCRLDRVCANGLALQRFNTVAVSHIELPGSDHILIRLQLKRSDQAQPHSRWRPFRFEAMWIRRDDCEEIVWKAWEEGGSGSSVDGMVYNGEVCRAQLMQYGLS